MKILALITIFLLTQTSMATLSPKIKNIIEKLDESCAGNDNGYIGTYDIEKYSTSEILEKHRLSNIDSNCKTIISTSKAEGVSNLNAALFSRNSSHSQCVNKTLTGKQQTQLASIISDPTNRAVFSEVWDEDSGDSESCLIENYYIYRADGTLINILFDQTD